MPAMLIDGNDVSFNASPFFEHAHQSTVRDVFGYVVVGQIGETETVPRGGEQAMTVVAVPAAQAGHRPLLVRANELPRLADTMLGEHQAAQVLQVARLFPRSVAI